MSTATELDEIHFSNWLTLIGFMGEEQGLNHVKSQGFEIKDESEWRSKVRNAATFAAGLTGRVNPRPEVKELGEQFEGRFKMLREEPTFQEHMVGMKVEKFALVELASLRCFQIQLNSEYLDSLMKAAPTSDDFEATVRFCLPTKDERQKTPMLASVNPASNTFTAVTENLDLRIVGNVQGEDPSTGRKFSGYAYGFGLPQISVVEYKGILILKNGYHRAYSLYKKGHKYLPCLFLSTDGFQFTGAQAPGFFTVDAITSPNGPILSDFDSKAAMMIPRRRLRVMVTVHAEIQVVPV